MQPPSGCAGAGRLDAREIRAIPPTNSFIFAGKPAPTTIGKIRINGNRFLSGPIQENAFRVSGRRVSGRMHDYENPKQAYEFGGFSSALQSPRNTGRLLGIQRSEKWPA